MYRRTDTKLCNGKTIEREMLIFKRTLLGIWFAFIITNLLSSCTGSQKKKSPPVAPQTDSAMSTYEFYNFDDIATLTGKLTIEMFSGPPNYGEETSNDVKEEEYVLLLENSLNMLAPLTDSSFYVEKPNIKKLQLISGTSLKHHLNSNIKVTGTLMRAQTGHHHTEVLLEVKNIQAP